MMFRSLVRSAGRGQAPQAFRPCPKCDGLGHTWHLNYPRVESCSMCGGSGHARGA